MPATRTPRPNNVWLNFAEADLASDLDMDAWEVFGNISWTPVSRTTFMLDLHYGSLDYSSYNNTQDHTNDAFAGILQVTRSF